MIKVFIIYSLWKVVIAILLFVAYFLKIGRIGDSVYLALPLLSSQGISLITGFISVFIDYVFVKNTFGKFIF